MAKFQSTNLVICSNSSQGKTLSYSLINMVEELLQGFSLIICPKMEVFERRICSKFKVLLTNCRAAYHIR